jgi:hypothetical protein
VYTRSGGVWSQQGSKLVGTGFVGDAQQGISVSLSGDGNTAIVGGPQDNVTGVATGAAWVYTRSGGIWTQQGSKLVGTDAIGAEQGNSVALSADGNIAIVGGPDDNALVGAPGVGAAWVYTRSNGLWTQQGPKLVGTGAVGPSQQGWSVALSGDGNTAIVGGRNDNPGPGAAVGAAWVFVQGPTLQVTPTTDMVATGSQGGPFTPSSFQYQLSATAGSIDYSISGLPHVHGGSNCRQQPCPRHLRPNHNHFHLQHWPGHPDPDSYAHRRCAITASHTRHQYYRLRDAGWSIFTAIFQLHPQRRKRQRELFNIQRSALAYVFFDLRHCFFFFAGDRDVHDK